jgi:hypothetical protein
MHSLKKIDKEFCAYHFLYFMVVSLKGYILVATILS